MYKVVIALILTFNISCDHTGYLNPNKVDPALGNLNFLRKETNYGGYWAPPSEPVVENDLPWCNFYGQYNCRPLWSNYYYPHGWLLYSPQNFDYSYGQYHQHQAPYPIHAGINSGLTAP